VIRRNKAWKAHKKGVRITLTPPPCKKLALESAEESAEEIPAEKSQDQVKKCADDIHSFHLLLYKIGNHNRKHRGMATVISGSCFFCELFRDVRAC
jgi:hypothetical protein